MQEVLVEQSIDLWTKDIWTLQVPEKKSDDYLYTSSLWSYGSDR